jgi:glycosyltransferase involved in cell wall biosynthesis
MDVSILIRTKNEAADIGDTLSRIVEQRFSGTFEIIIVDSGSTDKTLKIAKRFGVRIIQIPQRLFSYGRALNIGTESAGGVFVVNLSAHAKPENDGWLNNLLSGFDSEDVAGTYGRQIALGNVNPFEAYKNEQFFPSKRQVFRQDQPRSLQDIHFSNSNAAIRRSVWQKIKFHEEVGWAEDIIWQHDVLKAGYAIVYSPAASVEHTHPVDLCGAYRSSRDCAVALSMMENERRNVAMFFFDSMLFMAFWPKAMLGNLWYVWKRRRLQYLKTTPAYVLSAWIGWLFGRLDYRLKTGNRGSDKKRGQ